MPRNQTTANLSLEDLIQSAATLSPRELLELMAVVGGLLEATNPLKDSVADATTKGSIEWKMIPDKKRGKEYGPYPYLRYWKDGKLKSKYLKNYRTSTTLEPVAS